MRNFLCIAAAGLGLLVALPVFAQTKDQTSAQTKPPTVVQAPDLPQPLHPATVAQIKEYWDLTHAITLAHTAMGKMVDGMQATSAPYYPKTFWDDFRQSFNSFDLGTPMIAAYQRYISEEDMTQVLVFYRSPAGQHLLTAQPLIIAASQEVLQKAGGELGEQVYARHKDEIEAARAKYGASKP